MRNQIIYVICAMNLLAMLAGCGSRRATGNLQSMETDQIKADYRSRNSDRLNKALLKSPMLRAVESTADYVIGPEDVLEIEVLDVEEMKRTVRVNYQGFIGLPLVGKIKAKGLTPGQLEKEVNAKLEKYLQKPVVTVFVKEYKSQRIGVMGAVSKPEIYSVVGQKYLMDMLFMAGGLKDAGKGCYIFRPVNKENEESSATETIIVDLQELLEKGNRTLNIPVYSGDTINIPAGGVIYVDGVVHNRGMFRLASKTTLLQAIAMAGGISFAGDGSDIQVLRDTGEGTRLVIAADYEEAKKDTKHDIPIQENDIIIVGRSAIKTTLAAIGNLFTGAIGVGSGGVTSSSVGLGRTTTTGGSVIPP